MSWCNDWNFWNQLIDGFLQKKTTASWELALYELVRCWEWTRSCLRVTITHKYDLARRHPPSKSSCTRTGEAPIMFCRTRWVFVEILEKCHLGQARTLIITEACEISPSVVENLNLKPRGHFLPDRNFLFFISCNEVCLISWSHLCKPQPFLTQKNFIVHYHTFTKNYILFYKNYFKT